jgi:hypothetical protein
LFDQIALTTGARVAEIGCGPHGCLDLLSERVGPGARRGRRAQRRGCRPRRHAHRTT